MARVAIATRRTSGVSRYVTPAVTSRTRAYSRMPTQWSRVWWVPDSFIKATLWHRLARGGRLTGSGVLRSVPALQRMRLRRLGVLVLGLGVLRVVLVLADHRGHRAQPVHRNRAGAEHLRDGAGQVEDGGRDVVRARTAVQVHRNRLAELVLRLVGGDGGGLAVPVGAGHRERPGLLQHVQRDRVQRHPQGHRALGLAQVPQQRRAGPEDQGERARPELVDQVLPERAEVVDQRRGRPRGADQHRRRHVPAPALGRQHGGDRGRDERVRADAVHRVGRQHDQLAGASRRHRGVDPRGPRERVAAVVTRAHQAPSPDQAAVTKRSRPARSLWLRVSRQPDSSGNTQYTAAPCGAPCSTATSPPGRSSRRAVRSTARMASSPSVPLHRAAGGSYSPTSGSTYAPTGMYGGLLITRSTVPSSSRSAPAKSPPCSMTRPAVYGAVSTYLLTLRSAQARASGSASTACTLARGTSWPMASAIAPEPVPRSATTGSATSISRSLAMAQPVSTAVSGGVTNTPGPTSSSR